MAAGMEPVKCMLPHILKFVRLVRFPNWDGRLPDSSSAIREIVVTLFAVQVIPCQLQGVSVCSQPLWLNQFAPLVLLYNATSASHSAAGIWVCEAQSLNVASDFASTVWLAVVSAGILLAVLTVYAYQTVHKTATARPVAVASLPYWNIDLGISVVLRTAGRWGCGRRSGVTRPGSTCLPSCSR